MDAFFARTSLLLGSDAIARLQAAKVTVIGLGGVGGAATEALARSGIGTLVLVDGDRVADSNRNRQIFATRSTVGMMKTEAAARRIEDITDTCRTEQHPVMLTADADLSFLDGSAYCVDAIDDVRAKIAVYEYCSAHGIPVISAMGCGSRMDPTKLKVTDVFEVTGCPLCRKIRHELRKVGIPSLKVVASDEPPRPLAKREDGSTDSTIPSAAFVPNAAGLILASTVVSEIAEGTAEITASR